MRKYLEIIAIICFLIISPGLSAQNQNNFEIAKSLDIYSNLMRDLNLNYVDEIKPEKLMQASIDAMLHELDPYTVFIPESEMDNVDMMTTGSYGGIGVLIHQQDNNTIVSEVYEDFPAAIAGLEAGDKVIKVNNESLKNKSSSEISKMIKGPAKSKVTLTIERFGRTEPIEITIEREIVKIANVPFYTVLDNKVGYIKLVGFTQYAANEVKNALLELKSKNKLNGLILDVRGNGGGLMAEAIDIVNLFVDINQEVVSTKGKIPEQNMVRRTRFAPVDTEIPLTVLINNGSASAAEIVAGALQDMDRAVIIGQRSFGKGLVQNILPLSYNSMVKITIAKYYIPSGRCIQAIDYSFKDKNNHSTKTPDSLINEYKTKAGRNVYDGGGIEPDIKIETEIFSHLTSNLYGRFFIFDYATKYHQSNKSVDHPASFTIDDDTYEEFLGYLKGRDYSYVTDSDRSLASLKRQAEKDKYFKAIQDQFEALEEAMLHDKNADFVKYKNEIIKLLRMEIAARYYYVSGRVESSLMDDSEIDKAIEVLTHNEKYQAILLPEKPALVSK
ncbi:MAG: S41 family peptidase [Bacteroidetes bacterium]|nr:S41 family peptidase [Bacteroidota bacterium]